jgi:predicted RND superfamily exporter protein/outer membrane lipoprotein-sorting protein
MRSDMKSESESSMKNGPTMFERAGRAIGETVIAHPRKTLLVGLVAFLVVALGLTTARFSTDYRIFFSKDDPGLAAFERLESTFTKTDNVLFVVKAKEAHDGAIFQTDPLAAIQELTTVGWTLPYATRVDSLTNFQHPEAKEGDEIVVGELVPGDARALDAAALAHIRAAVASEPLLAGSLLARDGRTAAVNVTLRLPGKEPREVSESAEAARKAVDAVRARHPDLDIRASGMAFMNDAFMQASIRDMAVMMPLMVVVMLIGMAFVMRSKLATVAVAAVIGVSAAMSMAVAGWLHYPLTPPAVAAPMIVLTVAVADGVHIVLATMEAMREGKTRQQAVVLSLEKNLEAITYTWLTTIVGFVCLNYSDAPPVTHLANMTSFGVTAAFVYSFTVLPALLVVLPIVARGKAASALAGEVDARPTAMARVASFVVRRRIPLLVTTVIVTVIGGWQASRLETNDQFVRYFDQSIPFRRDVDFTMKNLSGIYRLEYQVGSGGPSGIAEPAYLRSLDAFGGWLRAQPEVEHVYSVADVVKRVNQVMSANEPAAYRIPDSRAAVSEALLVYEMGLPQGLDLTDRVNVDKSAARLTVTVKDVSSQQMNAFTARSESWLRDHAPKAMWAEATGPVVIFSQLGDRNAKSMVQGDFVSLALISLCMIIVLRSFRLGMLSVLPNVIPIVVGYGLWRVFVGQMNIVASVAGSISLGIIVDDTIHFLTRYKAMKAKGLDAETAMTKTLTHVGPAMLGTSVILVLGFGVLTLSSFQMTSYLGWLSVIIVAVAPLTDLVLAPALVLLFNKDPKPVALGKPRAVYQGTSIMKTAASFILGLFTLAVTVTASTDASARTAGEILASGSADAKGQAIALELASRNAGYKDLGGDVEMTLRDAGGGEAKRRFSIRVLEKPVASAGDYSLIVFDAPADVKGTAVLSHAKVGDDDEQWLYLPSAHRTRRISSSNRTGAFAGSEFSFEDLTGNDGRKYDWKLTGTEPCGPLTCFVVDATPKDPNSAYSKRVLRIDQEEFRIQTIEFYDRKNAKLKTLAYEGYKKLNERFWRSQSWTMKNVQSGKSTVISFSSMKVGNGFTVNDFATGKLGS